MVVYRCQGCGAPMKIAGFILQASIRCPGCHRIETVAFHEHLADNRPPTQRPHVEASGRINRQFPIADTASKASPERAKPEPTPVAQAVPALTAPHHCHQCQAPLPTGIGKRTDTVICPNCQQKTSAFAVLHRCAECSGLLESPTQLSGDEVTCPHCQRPVLVPWPVLHAQPIDDEVSLWFWCTCPSCDAQAAVRTEHVGVWGVCPKCLGPMQAPRFGERPNAADYEGLTRNVRCPGCQMQVPLAARGCPLCGVALSEA